MKRLLFILGTRPEAIKLSPVIEDAANFFSVRVAATGQHTSLFNDVRSLLNVNHELSCENTSSLNTMAGCILSELDSVLTSEPPHMCVVQGDTLSGFCGALASFHRNIAVGHVEAGLRTGHLQSPWPEEFYRKTISTLASVHWCSTELSAKNLRAENIHANVYVTGNTIVDFLARHGVAPTLASNEVVVTLHRRENSHKFSTIVREIDEIAVLHPELAFVFPVHPNPAIQACAKFSASNVTAIAPMLPLDFMRLVSRCKCVITDSGGVQEEAVCLGKRVIVCRDFTERPEAVTCGLGRVVGTRVKDNFAWALSPVTETGRNPFGTGHASTAIVASLQKWFET